MHFTFPIDIITLKTYDLLFRNFVTARDSKSNYLMNSLLYFDRGHRLIDHILQLQAQYYRGNDYLYNGPEAIELAFSNVCNLTLGNFGSNICTDAVILSCYYFHPI